MTLDTLRERLPAYAKDLSLNLSSLANETTVTDPQKWGAFVACAHALGQPDLIRAAEASATQGGLAPEAVTAAKAAAAIMGMNNVYYRALHLIGNPEYRTLPARLRMNVMANPGVTKVDFELWCTAVSAVNGCGMCLESHEAELKKAGVPVQQIQTALRIAAVTNAVARVLTAEGASQDVAAIAA